LALAIMSKNELRFQLAAYAEKFEQFQETLAKSNEIFATFKLDLEKVCCCVVLLLLLLLLLANTDCRPCDLCVCVCLVVIDDQNNQEIGKGSFSASTQMRAN
jgi:hypothetical protein